MYNLFRTLCISVQNCLQKFSVVLFYIWQSEWKRARGREETLFIHKLYFVYYSRSVIQDCRPSSFVELRTKRHWYYIMRLKCEVQVTNRLLPTLNIRKPARTTYTQVSIGKNPGSNSGQLFLMLCTAQNRSGTKYLVSKHQISKQYLVLNCHRVVKTSESL